jgi:hypothetical protein
MVATGVIRLGGSDPFQQDFKGALIRLGDGVAFRIGGEEDCRAGAGFGVREGVDRLGMDDGGGPGCTKAPACRWSSSSKSKSGSQNRPRRGDSFHWMTSSFNCFIRRRSGRWKESFAVTDRSLL